MLRTIVRGLHSNLFRVTANELTESLTPSLQRANSFLVMSFMTNFVRDTIIYKRKQGRNVSEVLNEVSERFVTKL